MRKFDKLSSILADIGPAAIAVSGGVDSMTLASFAYRAGMRSTIVHGLSPAVPAAATERVKSQAIAEDWALEIVDAGEFGDPNYRANPINRCYFCKSNLYSTIGVLAPGTILSGANCDDLSDFRPGLEAAKENDVRHPYVETGMTKSDVRELARQLGLGSIAELPSSPCLASRVETGISIQSETLSIIDRTETWLRQQWPVATIRCRMRKTGWVIELDEQTLAILDQHALEAELRAAIPQFAKEDIEFASYKRGSAFIRDRAT